MLPAIHKVAIEDLGRKRRGWTVGRRAMPGGGSRQKTRDKYTIQWEKPKGHTK